ncbi:MAG: DUF488 domain-containing protein [Vicinamibacterales bacterium]
MAQANRLTLPSASVKAQLQGRESWNESRSEHTADFFTFGYSGRKTDVILAELERAGVRTVVDIRQHAVSMYRPELTKSNFDKLLAARGIAYVHVPDLGVPRDIRAKAIATGSRDVIWDWYDEYVATPAVGRNLHWFLNSFEVPAALMCTEIDPHECHRHRLSVSLESQGLKGFDL